MFVLVTPVGRLAVYVDGEKVIRIDYGSRATTTHKSLSAFAKRVKRQIEAYFTSPASGFDVPLELLGTEFQKKVWRALQRIPAGMTLSYGELASRLHSSPRAVGNACRANPVPLIVPCHRVVAKAGIGGFGGKTQGTNIERKKWLLKHEGVSIQ